MKSESDRQGRDFLPCSLSQMDRRKGDNVKAIVTWDTGIEIVFTDVYKYLDYLERVVWSGNYREGWDYTIEEVFDCE